MEVSAWEIYTAASREIWIVAAEVTEKHVWETMICSLPYHPFWEVRCYAIYLLEETSYWKENDRQIQIFYISFPLILIHALIRYLCYHRYCGSLVSDPFSSVDPVVVAP